MFDLFQILIEPLNKMDRFRQKEVKMKVFSNLLNDFTELLTSRNNRVHACYDGVFVQYVNQKIIKSDE